MLRRTPMKRGLPLARTGGLKRGGSLPRKRSKPRRSSRVIDKAHLAFVRTLPCCAPGCWRTGPSDPNHATEGRGLGQKADDRKTVPNCRRCHRAFHDGTGAFTGMTKEERRAWHAAEVEKVMALKQAVQGKVVKQRLRIKLKFTIEHLTSEPGCTPALEAFSFAGAVRDALAAAGVIQGPAIVAPGAYRDISTEQEAAP